MSYGFAGLPDNLNLEEDAQSILRRTVHTLDNDRAMFVTEIVIHGRAASTLVEASQPAAHVGVETTGHGEVARMLLGSVSEYLTTHAHCPVVNLRKGARPAHQVS